MILWAARIVEWALVVIGLGTVAYCSAWAINRHMERRKAERLFGELDARYPMPEGDVGSAS